MLFFIPGLLDGLLTVAYSTSLAQALPPSWRLVQPILSSSYTGFGTSSLDKDVLEISQCIAYFQKFRSEMATTTTAAAADTMPGRVVIMGHSTGSQDVMHYLVSSSTTSSPPSSSFLPSPSSSSFSPLSTSSTTTALQDEQTTTKPPSRPTIHGAILQASVSDREALCDRISSAEYNRRVSLAESWIASGRGADLLPRSASDDVFGAPVTATRFLSLASPAPEHAGQDDYFSSDLGVERLRRTFGRIGPGVRLMVLFGGEDEYVPVTVDKEALVSRWVEVAQKGGTVVDDGTGVVQGADHDLSKAGEAVVQEVIGRVVRCLQRVEST